MPSVPLKKSVEGMLGALFGLNSCDVGAPSPSEKTVWKNSSVWVRPYLETTILPLDVSIVGVLEPANRFKMP